LSKTKHIWRRGLRFNFEAEGHSVETTARGEEALARLLENREPFDVVVLDVMLPGKDGFVVAREAAGGQELYPAAHVDGPRPSGRRAQGIRVGRR
jgi:DNA-binding response OmpR family regulator